MEMKRIIYLLALIAFTVIYSCKKVYTPQLVSVSTNFLAVDGDIFSGDSTLIRLSRTTKLTDTTQIKAELKAIVSVESDQNALYPLTEKGKGLYVLGVTTFDKNRKYRLNIKTSDGKIYQSDFVPMKVTPAIDSIYIKQTQPNEITFYADSHDATNNTRYYRFDYKDTWSYVSIYPTNYNYINGRFNYVEQYSAEDIGHCFRFSNSTELVVGSTVKLSQDVLKQQPIFSLTSASEKIAQTYVIHLREYAITKEGFEYYERLKKNTEQIGTIFDPQPSALSGNIHCITNPTELVLGFISASTRSTKQFTLYRKDNPIEPTEVNVNVEGINRFAYPLPYYEKCRSRLSPTPASKEQGSPWVFTGPPVADLNVQSPSFYLKANKILATGDSLLYSIETGLVYTYLYAPEICVDCRLRGGTNIKPSYYPAN
ncbi:MAG: DUF4249 domain-containing protein [Sphingobacteriaceae bacterium]|nr:MAG: DUF4249 domain-containing protein [Sphingobacteriaceae bacterium]